MKSDKNEVSGWFVCHEAVNPKNEIDMILRVSGSPYEEDCGSTLNDDDTVAAGVLVINRYDWGWQDHRGRDLYPDENEAFLTAGIVDRAHAIDEVNSWKDHPAKDRTASEGGVWMYIPRSEYIFARFGFDDAKVHAQSFIFFAGHTCFTQTAFLGLKNTLRKEETHEERFERRLHEGYNFSGVKILKELTRPPPFPVSEAYGYQPPPQDQWLGPYDLTAHLFRSSDIDALRMYTHAIGIAEQEMGRVTDLLNEIIMTYLERFVLPHCSSSILSQAATAIFPNYSETVYPRNLGYYLQRHFINASTDPPIECGYDREAVDTGSGLS